MQEGSHLLIDEISLADDAVLERLNSVLESDRKLLIPERGKFVSDDYQVIATDGFQLLATMNPGGDYGKKEVRTCTCTCIRTCIAVALEVTHMYVT